MSAAAPLVLVFVFFALVPVAVTIVRSLSRPPRPGRVGDLRRSSRRRAGRSPPRPPPLRRPVVATAAAVAAVAAVVVLGLVGAGLSAAAIVCGRRLRARAGRQRREAELAADVPEVADLLVVAANAGLTVPLAVAAVGRRGTGPLARHLGALAADAAAGRRLVDALDDLPRVAGEAARPLAGALLACLRDGAPVVPTLVALAAEAREQERRRVEQAARRVPVLLLFPLVLCVLPAFALLTVAPLLADAFTALRP